MADHCKTCGTELETTQTVVMTGVIGHIITSKHCPKCPPSTAEVVGMVLGGVALLAFFVWLLMWGP